MLTRCLKKTTNIIRLLDIFPSAEFLRYKNEPYYQTATGGCTSIMIVVVFILLFSSMGLQTVRKEIIFSTGRTKKLTGPTLSTMNFSKPEGFMFTLILQQVNLNDPNITYFDFEMVHTITTQPYYTSNNTDIPLVPCTEDHFDFSDDTRLGFSKFAGSRWLCPPMDNGISIEGRRYGPSHQYFSVNIKRCNSTNNPNCATDAQLQALEQQVGQFRLILLLITNTLNPDDAEYRVHSLESRNQITFSPTRAVQADVYVEQAIVNTDENIWPTEDIKQERYLSVEESVVWREVNVVDDTFMKLKFQKSPVERTYTRHFNKVDTFLSYVGGIIGTIIGILYLMHLYSRQAYSISIANKLFVSEDGEKIPSTAFHIGYLLLIPFRKALRFFNCCMNSWERTDFYIRCMDEANQQIDVVTIVKKLVFMEKAMSLLFNKHQLQALHLFKKEKIDQAEKKRKKLDLPTKLKSMMLNVQNGNEQPGMREKQSENYDQMINMDDEMASGQLSAASLSKMEIGSQKRLKSQLIKVLKESEQGNIISNQIMENLSPQILEKMGLNQDDVEQIMREQEKRLSSLRQDQVFRLPQMEIEPPSQAQPESEKQVKINSSRTNPLPPLKRLPPQMQSSASKVRFHAISDLKQSQEQSEQESKSE